MAIYEYTCQDCGMEFQARRPMQEADAPIDCPDCGGIKSKRGLSMFFSSRSGSGGAARVEMSSGSSGCGSCASHSCATCGH